MPNGYEPFEPISPYDTPVGFDAVINADMIATAEGTVVKLWINGTQYVGVAKTHPDDMPGDPRVGRDLALTRALRKALKDTRKRAYKGIAAHAKTLELEQKQEHQRRTAAGHKMQPPETLEEWTKARESGWLKNFGGGIDSF